MGWKGVVTYVCPVCTSLKLSRLKLWLELVCIALDNFYIDNPSPLHILLSCSCHLLLQICYYVAQMAKVQVQRLREKLHAENVAAKWCKFLMKVYRIVQHGPMIVSCVKNRIYKCFVLVWRVGKLLQGVKYWCFVFDE